MSLLRRLAAVLAGLGVLALAGAARAEQEFAPPQGQGPLVVMVSGMSGPAHYAPVAREIAAMGYDVVLFDGNDMEGSHGAALKAAILKAQQAPHALPGKTAVVGFSLGGGVSLAYASHWPDIVRGVVVWYPATTFVMDARRFVAFVQVPVLMLAGESDSFRNCCTIATARALGAAAAEQGKPLDLVTYPGVDHDFVPGGLHPDAKAYADGMRRTGERLKTLFAQP